jgi:lauroyl/myristoyl acyltransferase
MEHGYAASALAVAEKGVSYSSQLEALTDECELVAHLAMISDEHAACLLHKRYRPAYLNLFSLFRRQMPANRIHQLAVQLTRSSIWSVAAAERCLSRYPQNPLRLSLSGWQPEVLHKLLGRGRGLIVCSYRLGMYSLLPVDLAAMGFPLSIPLAEVTDRAKKAMQDLRDRVNADGCLDDEQRQKLLNISSIQLLDVEAKHTSIGLIKALRKGQVVMIYVDGNNGADGPWGEEGRIPVDFFGSPAFVKTGVARLSWSLGTPILPVVSLKSGPGAGYLQLADPIIPSRPVSPATKDDFVQKSMQCLYKILENYARIYPEQWEGVSALHRWRHASPAAVGSPAPVQEDAASVATALRCGQRLRINEPGGITAFPGEEGVWVDTETMKCFRIPSWAQDLFRALTEERGVDQGWMDAQVQKEKLLSLLAQLRVRRLIVVA